MMIDKDKLKKFLKDGYATFFIYELKHGLFWEKALDDFQMFEGACNCLNHEIRKRKNIDIEELCILNEIQSKKNIVWMEGPLGWTTWVDLYEDILH